MIREERRKARQRKSILGIIVGVVIFLALAFLIVVKVFCVKNIIVEGNKLYDASVIKKAVLND